MTTQRPTSQSETRTLTKLELISRRMRRDDFLPALPQILVRIQQVTRDRDTSASDLAEVILKDQALTAKILKVVGSAFFRQQSRKATTVTQAIVVLGFENVRQFALAATAQTLLEKYSTELLTGFWTHGVATGVCAHLLAQESRLPLVEEAFVAGLLHDVGKLVLANYFPEDYRTVWEAVREGAASIEAERRAIGVDHVEVGVELARRWHFEEALTEAIRCHHDLDRIPPSRDAGIPRIVHYANRLVSLLYRDQPADREAAIEALVDGARDLVGVSPWRMREVVADLPERMEDLAQCFNIRIDALPALPEPYRRAPAPEAAAQALRERQERWTACLLALSGALVREPDFRKVLELVLDAAVRGMGLARASLALADPSGTRMRVALWRGAPPPAAFVTGDLPLVAGTDAPLAPIEQTLGSRVLAAHPVYRRGRAPGTLLAEDPPDGAAAFTDQELAQLAMLANYASLALDRS